MKTKSKKVAVALSLAAAGGLAGAIGASETLAATAGRSSAASHCISRSTIHSGSYRVQGRRMNVPTPKAAPKVARPLVFSATTDKKSYKTGEPVKITMTVRNVSRGNRVLNFSSGRSFDIVVSPQNSSEPIWQWSQGRMFTQELRDVPLAAGESQIFSATWDRLGNDGKTVAPGKYQVTARLTTMGAGIKAAPIVITLK